MLETLDFRHPSFSSACPPHSFATLFFAMARRSIVALFLSLTCALHVAAQTGASASVSTPPPTSFGGNTTIATPTGGSATKGSVPDVYLNVPTLGVERIELGKQSRPLQKR